MEGANISGFWPVGKAGAVTIPIVPKGSPGLGPHESRGVGSPRLNDDQVDNVDAILAFVKATSAEDAKVVLDFDHLVTNENMQNILSYEIPISDHPFLKDRKGKAQKPKEDSAPITLKGL
jgi:hypothetical protein